MRKTTCTAAAVLAGVLFLGVSARGAYPYYECTSAISGNFNGTAIASGDYLWFTAVTSLKGLSTSPTTLFVSHSTITYTANGVTYTVKVPSATVTFDSSTNLATTDYEALYPPNLGTGWKTQLQFSGLAGNDLLTAVHVAVPSEGLPGGIKNVNWQVTFSSLTAGLTVNWQWAAAAYTSFTSDYDDVGVKPVDDNKASQYQNSDHAGTPENFKSFVTGGATGGGGANYTGSLSATGSCALTTDSSFSSTTPSTAQKP